MLKTTVVYKEGDLFYKKGQRFKGKLRPTIMDGRRAFGNVRHPRWGGMCPKSPRKEFSNDYKDFKETRGTQEIYVMVMDKYSTDSATGQFVVVCPIYKIDGDKIVKIYNSYRGRYPLSLLTIEPIEFFPREDGVVTPGEKIMDAANINGWDADMFVALRGFQQTKGNETALEEGFASMTGAGHFLPNPYNSGYDYIDGKLVAHEKDDRD